MDKEFRMLLDTHPDLQKFHHNIKSLVDDKYFKKNKGIYINRTPGRLDLMGGNDDYTGGLVFEKTIQEATLVAIQPRSDLQVNFYNPAVRSLDWNDLVQFNVDDLIEQGKVKTIEVVREWIHADAKSAWCAYILGDLYYLLKNFPDKITHGFSLYLESNIPLGKGVSSSAALEVAPMKAMAAMYGITAEGVELATWTQWVEIALTQSACGIMDQLTVVIGNEDYFVPMLCQPCQPYPLVKLPENLHVWGLDSGVRHSVAGIEYEAARAATFIGYRHLCDLEKLEPTLDESGVLQRWIDTKWNGYLANISPSVFKSKYEQQLPEYQSGADFMEQYAIHLDPYTPVRPEVNYPVRGATRYAIEENWRVRCFYSLISKHASLINETTCDLLGELMYQSHQGYSDCGLGTEATDMIVNFVREERGCGLYGAKVTGGGAGGTVAVLGSNSEEAQKAFQRVVERYQQWSGKESYIFEGSSAGCDVFGVHKIYSAICFIT